MTQRTLLAAALLAVLADPAAAQQHDHDHAPARGDSVGRVAFEISCAVAVRPDFERAVAMLHSFWFEQANSAFESVAARDSSCAMAHWGVAMTQLGNPFTNVEPSPVRLATAVAAAERATALGARATERERAWIAAATVLHADHGRVKFSDRMRAHEDAMRELHARYPDDQEAAIFHARAMIGNAPANDLDFKRQLAAAELLEPLFESRPDHPGLAHYIIHAYDSPRLAEQGLDAARRYAEIAPAAPHALHMPSHIFTRLGYWQESIDMNRRSASAEPDSNSAVHPMDYMVYAYLQLGRDREAGRVVSRAAQNTDRFYAGITGYNLAAMHARYALERERWSEAAALPVPAKSPPYVEAVTRFARALGAARSNQAALARSEVTALASLRDSSRSRGDIYWATIIEAQRLAASAWVARAEGRNDEALRLAREASELEGTVEKHPVTPGPLLPARELEADLLLALERPLDALRAYERTLTREPNRARTLHGAARAAEAAGDRANAELRYRELLQLMSGADPDRAEVQRARHFLSSGR